MMGAFDKHALNGPYTTVWLVRKDVESINTDGVWRITVDFKDGNTKTVSYDSTAQLESAFDHLQKWIKNEI